MRIFKNNVSEMAGKPMYFLLRSDAEDSLPTQPPYSWLILDFLHQTRGNTLKKIQDKALTTSAWIWQSHWVTSIQQSRVVSWFTAGMLWVMIIRRRNHARWRLCWKQWCWINISHSMIPIYIYIYIYTSYCRIYFHIYSHINFYIYIYINKIWCQITREGWYAIKHQPTNERHTLGKCMNPFISPAMVK